MTTGLSYYEAVAKLEIIETHLDEMEMQIDSASITQEHNTSKKFQNDDKVRHLAKNCWWKEKLYKTTWIKQR